MQQSSLNELREILLEEDRKATAQEIELLKVELQSKIELLDQKIKSADQFLSNLEASKNESIDIIAPYFGQLIKKYIANEVGLAIQKIEQTTNNLTSVEFWKRKFFLNKSSVSGIFQAQVQSVMLVENQSGVLLEGLSDASLKANQDVIAGMLTAIQAFMEDAFNDASNKKVGVIDYGEYKIMIHAYGSFYFCTIFKGVASHAFESKLLKAFDGFVQQNLKQVHQKIKGKPTDLKYLFKSSFYSFLSSENIEA